MAVVVVLPGNKKIVQKQESQKVEPVKDEE